MFVILSRADGEGSPGKGSLASLGMTLWQEVGP